MNLWTRTATAAFSSKFHDLSVIARNNPWFPGGLCLTGERPARVEVLAPEENVKQRGPVFQCVLCRLLAAEQGVSLLLSEYGDKYYE